MTLTRTTKQQERDLRNKQIVAAYNRLRRANRCASSASLCRTIAQSGKFDLSEEGVKKLLYRQGVITPKSCA